MMTPYEIAKCNALGRALPKAWKRLTSGRGPNAESPAWEENYHVYEAATREWRELRDRLSAEVGPWFDNSAFRDALPRCPKCGAEDSMEHRRHRFSTDGGSNMPDADWDECVVCGYTTDPE